MREFNWARVFVCGLVIGGIWTLLSVILLAFVADDFLSAVRNARSSAPSRGLSILLLVLNLAAGVWAMWLYAVIRPWYGSGMKTAIIAGLAWWVSVSMQSAKWVILLAIPLEFTLAPLVATLPSIILATMIGAWLYEK
jgi:hypothetical protein